MTTQADVGASGQHVPAWKRLGLKLKYAKEITDQPPTPEKASTSQPVAPFDGAQHSKRPRDEPAQAISGRPSKKARKSSGALPEHAEIRRPLITGGGFGSASVAQVQRAIASSAAPSHTRFDDDDEDQEVPANAAQAKPLLSRRKSVSFTPDTKNNDGFSAQNLFKAWASGEQDDMNDDSEQSSAEPISPSKQSRKEKKYKTEPVRRNTESKSQKSSKKESPLRNGAPPEYMQYIRHFFHDKSNWKFNKSKQNALFKNLFNIDQLPSEYDDAVFAYIGGLQGANAHQRILDDAESVLKAMLKRQERESDIEGMDTREARRIAYAAALQREIVKLKKGSSEDETQSLEEMQREVERSRRAEAIFAGLLAKEPAAARGNEAPKSVPERGSICAVAKKSEETSTSAKRKGRKARTEVSSGESSSESSSDSSSSESEND